MLKRDFLVECPKKPGLYCPQINTDKPDERIVLEGLCNGICPVSEKIFNDSRHAFVTAHGLDTRLFMAKEGFVNRYANRPDAPLLTVYDDQGATA